MDNLVENVAKEKLNKATLIKPLFSKRIVIKSMKQQW